MINMVIQSSLSRFSQLPSAHLPSFHIHYTNFMPFFELLWFQPSIILFFWWIYEYNNSHQETELDKLSSHFRSVQTLVSVRVSLNYWHKIKGQNWLITGRREEVIDCMWKMDTLMCQHYTLGAGVNVNFFWPPPFFFCFVFVAKNEHIWMKA